MGGGLRAGSACHSLLVSQHTSYLSLPAGLGCLAFPGQQVSHIIHDNQEC